MRMHPYPMVVAIVLLLAACRPAATEWTESEAPNRLRLDDAAVSVNVRFAAGSAYLLPADGEHQNDRDDHRVGMHLHGALPQSSRKPTGPTRPRAPGLNRTLSAVGSLWR